MTVLFLIVDEVTILEPQDNPNISQKAILKNMHKELISMMKQSTQEYYNIRIILGLECA